MGSITLLLGPIKRNDNIYQTVEHILNVQFINFAIPVSTQCNLAIYHLISLFGLSCPHHHCAIVQRGNVYDDEPQWK